MAQLGARLHGMQKVWGSSPHGSIPQVAVSEEFTADHPAVTSLRDNGCDSSRRTEFTTLTSPLIRSLRMVSWHTGSQARRPYENVRSHATSAPKVGCVPNAPVSRPHLNGASRDHCCKHLRRRLRSVPSASPGRAMARSHGRKPVEKRNKKPTRPGAAADWRGRSRGRTYNAMQIRFVRRTSIRG